MRSSPLWARGGPTSCGRIDQVRALERFTEIGGHRGGAKVVLIGDWAQLSAVETGGAFGMLVRDRDQVPELTDVRRFANDTSRRMRGILYARLVRMSRAELEREEGQAAVVL